MPTRLRVIADEAEWLAEIHGSEIVLDGAAVRVEARGDGRFAAVGAGGSFDAVAASRGDVVWVAIDGEVFACRTEPATSRSRAGARDHDALAPPMSATVVRIAVAAGDRVRRGDLLVALEAMKMELPIRAPRDGTVTAVLCAEGDLVQPGQDVVELSS